jgi:hypothetical protein
MALVALEIADGKMAVSRTAALAVRVAYRKADTVGQRLASTTAEMASTVVHCTVTIQQAAQREVKRVDGECWAVADGACTEEPLRIDDSPGARYWLGVSKSQVDGKKKAIEHALGLAIRSSAQGTDSRERAKGNSALGFDLNAHTQ